MSVQTYRRPVQAIFLIISIILLGGIARYCPFVGVQQIAGALGYDLIDEAFDAGTIRGFSRLTILVGGFTLFVIVFGRVWCGWICPFGSIMSAANSLKLPVRERSPPRILQGYSFKYELLAVFIGAAMVFGYPVFCQICPVGALYRTAGPQTFDLALIPGLSIAIISALFVIIYHRRFWCKSICPLGALTAILDKVSAFRVLVDEDTCIECMVCQRECPMDILVIEDSIRHGHRTVPTGECIRCGRCIDVCPKDALSFSFKYG